MKTKPLAFSVHLLTASGAALALMALVAAGAGDWRLMFGWLGIALIVDGIDGPLARQVDTKRNAANWDGVILDLVIDYLTYVFIPAYALIYSGIVPSPWGSIAALFIALTGAMYFADVRMKAEDNCFVGFPAVWQMPLLVFLTFDAPPWVTLGTILLLGLGQFTWLKFIHPVRTARWRQREPADLHPLGRARRLVGRRTLQPAAAREAAARADQRLAGDRRYPDAGLPAEAGRTALASGACQSAR